MGYTTEFAGRVEITPPLNPAEVEYLRAFARTRHMHRGRGPYVVDRSGQYGMQQDADVLDYNQPFAGQPELWCDWEPTADGGAIEWNGTEKFYAAQEWMQYLIDYFLQPGAGAKTRMAHWERPAEFDQFTFDHHVSGEIEAQGEHAEDRWTLVVTDNVTTRRER